jgi:hypothetical protein
VADGTLSEYERFKFIIQVIVKSRKGGGESYQEDLASHEDHIDVALQFDLVGRCQDYGT